MLVPSLGHRVKQRKIVQLQQLLVLDVPAQHLLEDPSAGQSLIGQVVFGLRTVAIPVPAAVVAGGPVVGDAQGLREVGVAHDRNNIYESYWLNALELLLYNKNEESS